MKNYITDSGNYALCGDCGTVIVLNQQWFKTPNHAWRDKSYKMLPYCPKCKKFKLKRLIGTGAGVIFKGDGFYETDYNRSDDYKKKSKKSKKKEPIKDKKK